MQSEEIAIVVKVFRDDYVRRPWWMAVRHVLAMDEMMHEFDRLDSHDYR